MRLFVLDEDERGIIGEVVADLIVRRRLSSGGVAPSTLAQNSFEELRTRVGN